MCAVAEGVVPLSRLPASGPHYTLWPGLLSPHYELGSSRELVIIFVHFTPYYEIIMRIIHPILTLVVHRKLFFSDCLRTALLWGLPGQLISYRTDFQSPGEHWK